MRNPISVFALGLLILSNACTQNPDVPEAVKSAFVQKFPNVTKVSWEIEDATSWEAEFELKNVAYSAVFSVQGEWVETEREIDMSEIPAPIQVVLDRDFLEFNVVEAEITEKPEGIFYELEVGKGDETWELIFDVIGQLVDKTNGTHE